MGGRSAVVYAALVALVTVAVVSAAGVAMEATGTDDRDILGGTMNADLIEAEAGIDDLFGLSGPDTYYGGDGKVTSRRIRG